MTGIAKIGCRYILRGPLWHAILYLNGTWVIRGSIFKSIHIGVGYHAGHRVVYDGMAYDDGHLASVAMKMIQRSQIHEPM
jgi:hypothetical protein